MHVDVNSWEPPDPDEFGRAVDQQAHELKRHAGLRRGAARRLARVWINEEYSVDPRQLASGKLKGLYARQWRAECRRDRLARRGRLTP